MSDHVWDAPVGATGQADIDSAAGLYDPQPDETAEDDRTYSELSKAELKAEAEARGLAVGGSKDDLVDRLAADDAEHAAAPDAFGDAE